MKSYFVALQACLCVCTGFILVWWFLSCRRHYYYFMTISTTAPQLELLSLERTSTDLGLWCVCSLELMKLPFALQLHHTVRGNQHEVCRGLNLDVSSLCWLKNKSGQGGGGSGIYSRKHWAWGGNTPGTHMFTLKCNLVLPTEGEKKPENQEETRGKCNSPHRQDHEFQIQESE